MTLFEALLILALISLVSAAAFSGVIRIPASLVLDRELSRLEAELALASRRAQRSGEAQRVDVIFNPPLEVDNCEGGAAPPLWSKPNGEVSAAVFCMNVRDTKLRLKIDWLTGRLIRESVE